MSGKNLNIQYPDFYVLRSYPSHSEVTLGRVRPEGAP